MRIFDKWVAEYDREDFYDAVFGWSVVILAIAVVIIIGVAFINPWILFWGPITIVGAIGVFLIVGMLADGIAEAIIKCVEHCTGQRFGYK